MFNFAKSRVKCSKVGAKVHVVKALICIKEDRPREPNEIEILAKSIDYIKALEAEVVRLSSNRGDDAEFIVNVSNLHYHGDVDDPKPLSKSLSDAVFYHNRVENLFGTRQL